MSVMLFQPGGGGGGDIVSTLVNSEVSITGAVTGTISKMHVCSGTSANYTVTLPAAAGNTGKLIGFRMATGLTKLVTIDGNASETIDGALTRPMWAGEACILLCDGSNWFKIAGKTIPMTVAMYKAADTGSPTSNVDTKIAVDTTAIDNSGLMADTTNKRINIQRTGYYLLDAAAWSDPGGGTITRLLGEIYNNGSRIQYADAPQWVAAAYAIGQIPQIVQSFTAADQVELYGLITIGGGAPVFKGGAVTNSHIALTEIPTW